MSKLHTILDPFLLRRLKSDVELGLPLKHEFAILAPLTATQIKFNEAIANQTLGEVVGKDAAEGFKVPCCPSLCVSHSAVLKRHTS